MSQPLLWKMTLIISIIFNVFLLGIMYHGKINKNTSDIQSEISCESIIQDYATLIKKELPVVDNNDRTDYSKTKETAQKLTLQLRFQRIYTQINDLCNLNLTDKDTYQKLTGDTTEME